MRLALTGVAITAITTGRTRSKNGRSYLYGKAIQILYVKR